MREKAQPPMTGKDLDPATTKDPMSAVWDLERKLGCEWHALHRAAEESKSVIGKIASILDKLSSEDLSVVVFGSLARREFTAESDLDWTLLVDASASDDHWSIACRVRDELASVVSKQPGREAIFGNLAFSHDLLHQIGGADDSNHNTTRRILLLLESIPIGRRDAYDRVVRCVLQRYLTEDEAFLTWRSEHPVPRFLLNDFARFWWTMAVDFAYKRRTRRGKGAVIRNLKLRMSRKLIYAAGMIACFSLALDSTRAEQLKEEGKSGETGNPRVKHFQELLSRPPLGILAEHLLNHKHLQNCAKRIYCSYNRFIQALADKEKRSQLENLDEDNRHQDSLYREMRQNTHEFRDGLIELFFDEKSSMSELTKKYGVF